MTDSFPVHAGEPDAAHAGGGDEALAGARSSGAPSGGHASDSGTRETNLGASPVINRTARRKLTYEYAQLSNTTALFRKPIKKKR
jgi:hypothetical protein